MERKASCFNDTHLDVGAVERQPRGSHGIRMRSELRRFDREFSFHILKQILLRWGMSARKSVGEKSVGEKMNFVSSKRWNG